MPCTLVVVSILLTSGVGGRASGAARDPLALLSDWADNVADHGGGDAELPSAAADGIVRLHHAHGPALGGDRFLLLHRRRVWSAGEARCIGWERNRGKLRELNRLLRGATDTTFLNPPPVPAGVRYVVTLDSDTRLPRGAACRLVGKMAHPLNAPLLVDGHVVEGHAVLQPRVTPLLPTGRSASVFQRIFSSMDGIDSYAAATCTRTCSASDPMPERASTTWMRWMRRCRAGCRRPAPRHRPHPSDARPAMDYEPRGGTGEPPEDAEADHVWPCLVPAPACLRPPRRMTE